MVEVRINQTIQMTHMRMSIGIWWIVQKDESNISWNNLHIYGFVFTSTLSSVTRAKTPRSQSQAQSPAHFPLAAHKGTLKNPCQNMCVQQWGELSGLLTVYELAFLLFRVKEAAQVEDDGQKEHEAGHGDDGHRLLPGEGTFEVFTPQPAGHVHLKNEAKCTT